MSKFSYITYDENGTPTSYSSDEELFKTGELGLVINNGMLCQICNN